MARLVFRYRTTKLHLLIGFFGCWSVLWTVGALQAWWKGQMTINGHVAHGSQAALVACISVAIGSMVFGGVVTAIFYCLNTRIEIVDGEIFWFNHRNRSKVRGRLPSARVVSSSSNVASPKLLIDTDGGRITVYKSIQRYGLLKRIVEQRGEFDESGHVKPVLPSSYIPAQLSYNFRWGVLHLFSFLLLCILAVLSVFPVIRSVPAVVLHSLWFGFFLLAFAMHLKGWNEQIQIGRDGIRWIDLFGRSKVKASLGQIIEVAVSSDGEGRSTYIHTTEGPICVSEFLRGRGRLIEEVEQLISHRLRQSASDPPVHAMTAMSEEQRLRLQ